MSAAAIKVAAKTRQRLLGLKATYRRGADSVALRATPGHVERELIDGDQVTNVDSRALLVIASELQLGGAVVTPEEQDVITATIGGVAHTFEVTPLMAGAQAWEWVDVYGIEMRIHVQRTND